MEKNEVLKTCFRVTIAFLDGVHRTFDFYSKDVDLLLLELFDLGTIHYKKDLNLGCYFAFKADKMIRVKIEELKYNTCV